MFGYDHKNRSSIYTYYFDKCRNNRIYNKYDLKNYYSNYRETNQSIISNGELIIFPSKANSNIFSPLLKFDSKGHLVNALKIYFNNYLISSYIESGICKISENKFGIYLPNYISKLDTSFGLLLILDNNFNIINKTKVINLNNLTNQIFGFGIYYMDSKILIVHSRDSYSILDTNLTEIKSYSYKLATNLYGGENACQLNDSILFFSGSSIYDFKNQ